MIDFGYHVKLEDIQRSDLPLLRNWRNKREIWRWCRQHDLIRESDHEAWFDGISRDKSIRMYLVIGDGDTIGVAGLTSIDHVNSRAEFSLYIAPEFQRTGYGKMALQTLLSHGFYNLNLNLIWGESFESNPAGKMFLSLGFTCEGFRRQFYFRDGEYINAAMFSITRNEWTKTSQV